MLANNQMSPESQPNPYLVQKIMTASPEELISYIYEAAIRGCVQKNQGKALEAVQQLINALNFDAGDVSANFYKVYTVIQNHIYNHDFNAAREILIDLRKTWSKAMNIR
jgi:flagellin-specific chaperone FliS